METKLNFKEIVPANDILEDEMEFVKGGTDLNFCFKGCITGDKSDKTKDSTTTQHHDSAHDSANNSAHNINDSVHNINDSVYYIKDIRQIRVSISRGCARIYKPSF